MIIDSCFDTFKDIIKARVPIIGKPIGRLFNKSIESNFYPIENAYKIKIPKLFIHGTQDKIIPYERGLNLYEKASQPKNFLKMEQEGHMSIFSNQKSEDIDEVMNFINSLISRCTE